METSTLGLRIRAIPSNTTKGRITESMRIKQDVNKNSKYL